LKFLVARREIIEKLLEDPEFNVKLDKCKSFKEVQKLVAEFAEKKGFKVLTVSEK